MTGKYLPLPLFVIVLEPEYDERTDTLTITGGETPTLEIKTPKGPPLLPVFTTRIRAQAFVNDSASLGRPVQCGAERVIAFIEAAGNEHACIDPIFGKPAMRACTAASLISAIRARIAHEN